MQRRRESQDVSVDRSWCCGGGLGDFYSYPGRESSELSEAE